MKELLSKGWLPLSATSFYFNLTVRFTDFLVYEVDQDGKVLHLKSLGKPESRKAEKEPEKNSPLSNSKHVVKSALPADACIPSLDKEKAEDSPATNSVSAIGDTLPDSELKAQSNANSWSEHFDKLLSTFLDGDKRAELKRIYLEGPEPPRVSDNGWSGRVANSNSEGDPSEAVETPETHITRDNRRNRGGKHRGRGAGRGGRTDKREDTRKVLSEVSRILGVFTPHLTHMKIAYHI